MLDEPRNYMLMRFYGLLASVSLMRRLSVSSQTESPLQVAS